MITLLGEEDADQHFLVGILETRRNILIDSVEDRSRCLPGSQFVQSFAERLTELAPAYILNHCVPYGWLPSLFGD